MKFLFFIFIFLTLNLSLVAGDKSSRQACLAEISAAAEAGFYDRALQLARSLHPSLSLGEARQVLASYDRTGSLQTRFEGSHFTDFYAYVLNRSRPQASGGPARLVDMETMARAYGLFEARQAPTNEWVAALQSYFQSIPELMRVVLSNRELQLGLSLAIMGHDEEASRMVEQGLIDLGVDSSSIPMLRRHIELAAFHPLVQAAHTRMAHSGVYLPQIMIENLLSCQHSFALPGMGVSVPLLNYRPQDLYMTEAVFQFAGIGVDVLELGVHTPAALAAIRKIYPGKVVGTSHQNFDEESLGYLKGIEIIPGDPFDNARVFSQLQSLGPFEVVYSLDPFRSNPITTPPLADGVDSKDVFAIVASLLKEGGVFLVMNDQLTMTNLDLRKAESAGLKLIRAFHYRSAPRALRSIMPQENPLTGDMVLWMFRKGQFDTSRFETRSTRPD